MEYFKTDQESQLSTLILQEVYRLNHIEYFEYISKNLVNYF